jgi:hypothetical protein
LANFFDNRGKIDFLVFHDFLQMKMSRRKKCINSDNPHINLNDHDWALLPFASDGSTKESSLADNAKLF